MEDLPLCRIAAFMPEFAMKDLPLGRTLMMNDDMFTIRRIKNTGVVCI